jgi:hypothetical protein
LDYTPKHHHDEEFGFALNDFAEVCCSFSISFFNFAGRKPCVRAILRAKNFGIFPRGSVFTV